MIIPTTLMRRVLTWIVFVSGLAVLIALIEGYGEVPLPVRLLQKILTLFLNVLPAAFAGYLVLSYSAHKPAWQRRVFTLLVSIAVAELMAVLILQFPPPFQLIPDFLRSDLPRYFGIVAVIATILDLVAAEFEIRKVVPSLPYRSETEPVVTFSFRGATHRCDARDILYVCSDRNYCTVVSTDQQVELKLSLSAMETKLRNFNLRRVHRRYLVNIGRVKLLQSDADGCEITLNDTEETILPVGRAYLRDIRQALQ